MILISHSYYLICVSFPLTNPDPVVLESIQKAAISHLSSRNSSEESGKTIDSILMNGLNTAKAFRGRKDLDNFLAVKVIEFGNNDPREFRVKVSTLLVAMAESIYLSISNHNISPCMLLEGYLADGLVLDSGKFYRLDGFARLGQTIGKKQLKCALPNFISGGMPISHLIVGMKN